MSGHARKLRRAANRRAHSDEVPQELIDAAVASLELDEQQSTAAIDELREVRPLSELGDALAARLLELTELVYGSQPDLPEARARIEERRGVGFLAKVSAMGRPAVEVLGSHKIHAGNFTRRCYRPYHARLGRQQVWIPSRENCGNFGRRFSSRRFSPTGCARGGSSSYERASRSRSYCVGGGVAFALGRISRSTSRTLRSNGAAARSSARLGALISLNQVRR